MAGEYGRDRHPLLLARRHFTERAKAHLLKAEKVDHLLNARAHHAVGQPKLLHAIGELIIHTARDETRRRILTDGTHQVRKIPRRMGASVAATHNDSSGQLSTGEVRCEAVDQLQ